ncbi:hypothetical protein E2C01_026421 [Portunus trituberculatus]|uniref:Uncharacterized protein n=1 Tax=Portunus trituberculatus TaxID=210409 RepID=A0A5B7EFL4_PORTR|nr:hypothetical protein [Portunus trituberculatus]
MGSPLFMRMGKLTIPEILKAEPVTPRRCKSLWRNGHHPPRKINLIALNESSERTFTVALVSMAKESPHDPIFVGRAKIVD